MFNPIFDGEPAYIQWIVGLRKAKALHTVVEDQLVSLLHYDLPGNADLIYCRRKKREGETPSLLNLAVSLHGTCAQNIMRIIIIQM